MAVRVSVLLKLLLIMSSKSGIARKSRIPYFWRIAALVSLTWLVASRSLAFPG